MIVFDFFLIIHGLRLDSETNEQSKLASNFNKKYERSVSKKASYNFKLFFYCNHHLVDICLFRNKVFSEAPTILAMFHRNLCEKLNIAIMSLAKISFQVEVDNSFYV